MNAVPLRMLPALALALILGLAGTLGAGAQTVSSCTDAGSGSGGFMQVTCRISTGVSMTAPNTLYVVTTSPAGATTTSCSAAPGAGGSVQGSAATVPATAATTGIPGVGLTGCSLRVQTSSVPAGASVGTIGLTLPAMVTSGTTMQLSTLVCSDPSCAALISSQQVSATVSQRGNGRGRGDRDDNNDNDNSQYNQCPYTGYCQTGTQYCNGVYIPTGQYCSQNGIQYCNGQPLPPGGTCNTYCATGQIGAIGQSCFGGVTVTYPAGWNIVAGPTGTVLPNVASPLYSFPAGASAYVPMPGSSPLQAGTGYWAYFTTSTTVTLPPTSANTVNVQLTPSVYTLIGNPSNGVATVSGTALSVLTYNPASGGGYTPTTQLQPGQGAWVASPLGGTVTISSGFSPLQPPAPPPPLAP